MATIRDIDGKPCNEVAPLDAAKYFAAKHFANPRRIGGFDLVVPGREATFDLVGGRRTYLMAFVNLDSTCEYCVYALS